MTELQKQEVTVQLLHTALEEIFFSIEVMPNAQLDDHLSPYVDKAMLHSLLAKHNVIEPPEVIHTISRMVQETFGTHMDILGNKMREQTVYETAAILIDAAFSEVFAEFIGEVEDLLEMGVASTGRSLNRYSTVELRPHCTPAGRIVSLELNLGEDIRHIYFSQQFPDGRYSSTRPHDDDSVRDVQSVPRDII